MEICIGHGVGAVKTFPEIIIEPIPLVSVLSNVNTPLQKPRPIWHWCFGAV